MMTSGRASELKKGLGVGRAAIAAISLETVCVRRSQGSSRPSVRSAIEPSVSQGAAFSREARFAVSLRVSVRAVGQVWWTRTRDLGARGLFFYADNPPAVGTAVEVTLRADAEVSFVVHGRVRFRVAEIGADVELDAYGEYAEWLERRTTRMSGTREISGCVRASSDEINLSFDRFELVPLGADLTPIDLLFAKHPPISAWRVLPDCHSRLPVSCLSPERVGLRLSSASEVIWAWVGITFDGEYVGVVPAEDPQVLPRVVRLRASVQIALTRRGQTVFPHFDARDRVMMAENHVAVRPSEPPMDFAEAGAKTDSLASLAEWVRFDAEVASTLDALFTCEEARTRTYRLPGGPKSARLLVNLGLEVLGSDGQPTSGLLFHDGARACVLLARPDDEVVIRALDASDEIRLRPEAAIVIEESLTFEELEVV
ncbi:MAG: PilZ domain-containing protein [Deltaproteobacteria bacterium]|nr:PilZ domain-containing protein [Deltaproteobacteria bacterium]